MSRLILLLIWLPLVASAIPRAINPVDVMVVDSGSVQPKLWPIDSIVSDSVAHADTADVAFKSLLTTHGVTPGIVPKAATDSTFTNSNISENGDTTTVISYPVYTSASTLFQAYDLAVLPYSIIVAGTHGGNIYRSVDNGSSWGNVGKLATNWVLATAYCENGIVLAAGGYGLHILRSTDYGATWADLGLQSGYDQADFIVYAGSGVALAVCEGQGKYLRSIDYGATWNDLGRPQSQIHMYDGESLGSGIVLIGGSTRILRSTDYGATWTATNLNGIVTSVVNLGGGFVIASSGAPARVYRSEDYGANWNDLGVKSQYSISKLCDIGNGRIVAVSSYTTLIMSNDSGINWSNMPSGGYCNSTGINRIVKVTDKKTIIAVRNSTCLNWYNTYSTVFSVTRGNSYFGGKVGIENPPTSSIPAYVLVQNEAPNYEVNKLPITYFDTTGNGTRDSLLALRLPLHGKADSSGNADMLDGLHASEIATPPHNVTPGQIPMSTGGTSWRNTGTMVDSTTGDIHVYGKIIVGDTAYTSVPGMVEGHGNQTDVNRDSLMTCFAAAPAGDKRRGGAFRTFGNEAPLSKGNATMIAGDSGQAIIEGNDINIHVFHPSDTSSLGVPVFKNDVRIGRDDVLPDDTDRVAIYLGRSEDSSCGRIYGGKGASSTKATIELGNNTNNKITISSDTVRIIDMVETIRINSTLGSIDTLDVGLMRVGGGSNIIDIHRRTDTLVIKLSATDSLCFEAVAP